MGLCISNNIDPATDHYNDIDTYEQLKYLINDSGVFDNADIKIYIDMTESNILRDGTSMHDIPFNYPNMSNHEIINQYIYCVSIIEKIITDNSKINNIKIYKYGLTNEYITELAKYYDYKTRSVIDHNNMTTHERPHIYRDLYVGAIKTTNKSEYGSLSVFTPIIDHVINEYKNTGKFQICMIITDGIIDERHILDDIANFFKASEYPIGFVCICVGDHVDSVLCGIDDMNYELLGKYRDQVKQLALTHRKFDNIQTVVLRDIITRPLINETLEQELYRHIFMEIPRQYIHTRDKQPKQQNIANRFALINTAQYFNNDIELKTAQL